MRLRRLALTDVGGVDASELIVPETGVSVVLAPNETGKSTLLRAYQLLLSRTLHTGRGADAKALQPVGRDVGSTIEAELVIGGDTFEVARTYNRQVSSTLTVRGAATVTVTGKEADDLLRARFLDAVDQDLYALLVFEQGRTLEAPAGGASATLVGALRAHGAGGASGEDGAAADGAEAARGDGVLEALRARVGRAFHARNGTPIGDLRRLHDEVADAAARRDELAGRIETLAGGGAGGGAEDELGARVAELRDELTAITVRIGRAGAAAQAATARTLLAASTERVRRRQDRVDQVAAAAAEEQELTARIAATQQELTTAQQQLAELEEQAAEAGQQRATLVADAAQAEADLLAALDAAVAQLTAQIAAETVDAQLVRQARDLDRDVAVTRGALESGSWELRIEAARALELEVDGERVEVEEGTTLRRPVSASLVLTDSDGTVLDLHADAGRQASVGRLAAATAALAKLLDAAGAADLGEVEMRLRAREDASARVAELERRARMLRDDAVAEPLPPPRPQAGPGRPEDPEELGGLESAHRAALGRLSELGPDSEGALAAVRMGVEQRTNLLAQQTQELARSSERREAAERALAEDRAAASDETLGEEAAKAASALAALGEVGEEEDVAALEQARERLSGEHEDAQRHATLAEGRRASAGALRATLENLEERHGLLDTQLQRALREAGAARALRDRLEQARAEQGDRYREPLEHRIGELLTVLYGYDCRVELDDDLRIVQRSEPDGRMVGWAALSGGAKEQAAVVTGLAIAELAGDGGVPLWIDDAIVFTDDARVERLKELLVATTAQVIVLTCRSELAAGLPAATFTTGG